MPGKFVYRQFIGEHARVLRRQYFSCLKTDFPGGLRPVIGGIYTTSERVIDEIDNRTPNWWDHEQA